MDWLPVPANVQWLFAGVLGLLVAATLVVAALVKLQPERDHSELSLRIRSWWAMIAIFGAAVAFSRTISIVFLGFVSFLALKEYLSLIPTRRVDRRMLLIAYLAAPVQFYWVATAWYGMFIVFIPVYMFILLPVRMVLEGEPRGFLNAAGTLHWGLMTTVFNLAHAAYLLVLPEANNPAAGGAGLLLYLVFLTQFNDVAQYVWGRSFGKRKVAPTVSPNKTWEGLVLGVLTTVAVGAASAPYLTPLAGWERIAAPLLIGVAGFFGDITVSALKRNLGIKDSGSLIPGHGGILDRVDSLTFTAPLFFHFIYYLHY